MGRARLSMPAAPAVVRVSPAAYTPLYTIIHRRARARRRYTAQFLAAKCLFVHAPKTPLATHYRGRAPGFID